MACVSSVGFICGSQKMTILADWIFKPTPPACICETNTCFCSEDLKMSNISCLCAEDTAPVIGVSVLSPSSEHIVLMTLLKKLKTMTFFPFAAASSQISMSRFSLGLFFFVIPCQPARRINMNSPFLTASR